MKTALLMMMLAIAPVARAQSVVPPVSKDALSMSEQIRAARAKADREEETGPKERFWDRDADGKRPWDRKEIPSKE
jgi:hypothetical protein